MRPFLLGLFDQTEDDSGNGAVAKGMAAFDHPELTAGVLHQRPLKS